MPSQWNARCIAAHTVYAGVELTCRNSATLHTITVKMPFAMLCETASCVHTHRRCTVPTPACTIASTSCMRPPVARQHHGPTRVGARRTRLQGTRCWFAHAVQLTKPCSWKQSGGGVPNCVFCENRRLSSAARMVSKPLFRVFGILAGAQDPSCMFPLVSASTAANSRGTRVMWWKRCCPRRKP